MLQRAASNAYSWWWASHIRTKQSKWLEQNLQDMEEKVQNVLHLLMEDGDSFAKRAEMYYKKRPELINFVEETFKAYRALAERYEKISTDLQNANTTIASVFPEQVQFSMDDDDYDGSTPHFRPNGKLEAPKPSIPKVPAAPPKKNLKNLLTTATKKLQSNKFKRAPVKSGLTEGQAIEEIDKLQKEILTLQTEKEFVKSSYENKLARYWDIDGEISEMQGRISSLQDEFNVGSIIEDDEARTLMASSALKSCQDTLASLEEKQGQSAAYAKTEHQKISNARSKLENIRYEMHPENGKQPKPSGLFDNLSPETVFSGDQSVSTIKDYATNEWFNGSLSVAEMAEKIDELVQKVISLETEFSSQTVNVKRLRTEADELQKQVLSLEADKAALIDGTNSLTKQLEEKSLQILASDSNNNKEDDPTRSNADATEQQKSLDTELEAGLTLQQQQQSVDAKLSDSLLGEPDEALAAVNPEMNLIKPDEEYWFEAAEVEKPASSLQSDNPFIDVETVTEVHTKKLEAPVEATINPNNKPDSQSRVLEDSKHEEPPQSQISQDPKTPDTAVRGMAPREVENHADTAKQLKEAVDEDEANWHELFMSGLQDKEKIILREYTNTLRNYKDLKKKLTEVEKKNDDTLLEFVSQIRELRSAISKKDEEIQSLHQKLSFLKEHKDSEEQPSSDPAADETSEHQEGAEAPRATETSEIQPASGAPGNQDNADNERVLKEILSSKNPALSPIEEKFRTNIDELLEENLNFWLRFSSAFNQIQKFQTEAEDLQAELAKTEEKKNKKQDGSSSKHRNLKSDIVPIYKHLSEINTEISVWLEQSVLLKEELQSRFSSLCSIQEEISAALVAACGVIEEAMFTSYQAAKFQGEILNMKQENNKVDDELQSAIDHATRIQLEIEKTLAKLDEEYRISGAKNTHPNQPRLTHSESRNRVPLQSFIFGVKPKKQRYSIFSVMHPAMLKRHHDLKTGL
uniref:NAB domain-containing protein n=1 Tax=Kalanchoe fedtschenkoi TaxID=63787 RepID=A0A7N0TIG2_KALFE